MNRRIAIVVAVVFALASIVCFAQDSFAKELKIGYANPAKIMSEYGKAKDAGKSLEGKFKVKDAERKKMVDEITKMKDEQAMLSDKAKAEKQAAIDSKIKTLQDFDKKAREELINERNDVAGGLENDVFKSIAEYAKANGYDIVLDSRAMLYGKSENDFTADIVKALNVAQGAKK
jgi:outer membrane protein